MLEGSLLNPGVPTYKTRIKVNGVERRIREFTFDAQMRSDLPAKMVKDTGTANRVGDIDWAQPNDVQNVGATPYRVSDTWFPRRGDSVTIEVGDGTSWWKRFTGVIGHTTGTPGSPGSSEVLSELSGFEKTISSEALLAQMPPLDGAGSAARPTGLSIMHHFDRAARVAGFHATPARESYTMLSVPLQGSILPEGEFETLKIGSTVGYYPAPWGLAAAGFSATYVPGLSTFGETAIQISLMVAPTHSGATSIRVRYGASKSLRVSINSSRIASVFDGDTQLASLPLGASEIVCAIFRDGTVTLKASSTDTQAQGTYQAPTLAATEVSVSADAASRIAGVLISQPLGWNDFRTLAHKSTAIYRMSTPAGSTPLWGSLSATPRVEKQQVESRLSALCDAALMAMWVDEEGRLIFCPSNQLRGRTPVQGVTTARDIFGIEWSDELVRSAASVRVTYDHPYRVSGNLPTVTVASGSSSSTQLLGGETHQVVYSPPAGEDWIGVDESMESLGASIPWTSLNRGSGSMTGMTFVNDSGVELTGSYGWAYTVKRIGVGAWVVEHSTSSLPAGVAAELRSPEDDASIWKNRRNLAMPLLRAYVKLDWQEKEKVKETGLPGGVLEVDCGGLVTEEIAGRLADHLKSLMEADFATLSAVPLAPDPRRQLGDIITISSPNYLGVSLTCLITSIHEEHDGEYRQTCEVDVLSVKALEETWGEWANAAPPAWGYEEFIAARGTDDTYQGFITNTRKGF